MEEAAAANAAYDAVVAHPKAEYFRALDAVLFGQRDVVLYLLKQCTRVAAGLTFVELLILWGALRSGKDTFVVQLSGSRPAISAIFVASPPPANPPLSPSPRPPSLR
jgi:hypothetical protein